MAQALAEELPDLDSQEGRAKIDAEKQRPLRAPVIIAVAVLQSRTWRTAWPPAPGTML